MANVKFLKTISSSLYGNFVPTDILLNITDEFASFLVNDVKAAEFLEQEVQTELEVIDPEVELKVKKSK